MTDAEIGYMARLIDGEGTICLVKHAYQNNYAPIVAVEMSDIEVIKYCQSTTKLGTFNLHREAKGNCSSTWRWRLKTDEIIPFLLKIKDNLILKSLQAELLIEYISEHRGILGGRSSVSDQTASMRSIIWQELTEANKKGIECLLPESIAKTKFRYKPILTQNQLGSLAAAIDGEGSIGFLGNSYCPVVKTTNTNVKFVNWCLATTNMGYIHHRPTDKDNWKSSYDWNLDKTEMLEFLETIDPYLVGKKDQSDLMKEYLQNCLVGPGRKCTLEQRYHKQFLRQKLRKRA